MSSASGLTCLGGFMMLGGALRTLGLDLAGSIPVGPGRLGGGTPGGTPGGRSNLGGGTP